MTAVRVFDPAMCCSTGTHLRELADHAAHIVLEPWSVGFVGGHAPSREASNAGAVA